MDCQSATLACLPLTVGFLGVEMFQSILFERVFQMRQERCNKTAAVTEIADLVYRSRNQDTPGADSNSTGVSLLDQVNCVEDRRY